MERQYKKIVGKQVDLFINYELHEHNITNYSNDFDIFVGNKKTKKIFEQIIKIINSPHDSLNTIKLKNIILNHDLFISIGIINTIRPKSVFIKILDKQKLKLKHIVIFMNSYIESAILLKTLDTNRYFIPLCLPVKKRDENKYLLDIEYDCRGTFMYKYPDVITVLRKYYNNTVTSSNIFGFRQNMHTANYIDFIFSLLRLSKEITKIDNDNIISYASCLSPTNENQEYIITATKTNSTINAIKSRIKSYSDLFDIMKTNDMIININSVTKLYSKNTKRIKLIKKLVYLLHSCSIPYELNLIFLSFF